MLQSNYFIYIFGINKEFKLINVYGIYIFLLKLIFYKKLNKRIKSFNKKRIIQKLEAK